ncbi:flavin reductase family protein [Alkalihalobacterium alkalinitrilicum]|uniref:flavin reductase family protein n=1 Tax=Alkalihalobacterium alkalinitrilicum TaxID=427920 RepID=UPI000995C89B|nr:flavin reductase family protein [Alkalihalobacterium alkalinitrilicum]
MKIETSNIEWLDRYKLLIGSVLPRPIAFVSSLSKNNIANLAPFSFFMGIGAEPMMLAFSVMRDHENISKDTLVNVEETKEFVVNIVGEKIVNQMNECATNFQPEIDEFEVSGLEKEPCDLVRPPRVKESDVSLECVLDRVINFGEGPGSSSLVIGKVVMIHVNDEIYANGKINTKELQPIGRLAGNEYTRASASTFSIERKRIK